MVSKVEKSMNVLIKKRRQKIWFDKIDLQLFNIRIESKFLLWRVKIYLSSLKLFPQNFWTQREFILYDANDHEFEPCLCDEQYFILLELTIQFKKKCVDIYERSIYPCDIQKSLI